MSNQSVNKRTSNFTTEELEFLLELVHKHDDIIGCKKTDRVASERKARVWKYIAIEFNKEFGRIYRSDRTLKTKYDNYKKLERRKYGMGDGRYKLASHDFIFEEISLPKKYFEQDNFFSGDEIKDGIVISC